MAIIERIAWDPRERTAQMETIAFKTIRSKLNLPMILLYIIFDFIYGCMLVAELFKRRANNVIRSEKNIEL